jgi:putative FmdB family regulatory protein
MPIYEYHCDACKADFEHMTSISSRDKKVACPQCGSRKTGRKLSSVTVGSGGKPSSSGGGSGGGCCGGSCRCRG